MNTIYCKIKWWVWPYFLFLMGGVVFCVKLFSMGIRDNFVLGIGVAVYLLSALLIIIKDFKYVVVCNRYVKIYSIYHPLGKRYYLDNYIGVIISKEYASAGPYTTAYLIDKSMHTSVKFNGRIYRNLDEMIASINLPEIKNYDFGFLKYIQLLFTGRIKIKIREKKMRKANGKQGEI